ncbi:hypothetical protein BKA65DRAFT_291149 [Rhexocercosporidium sp. MPI-PUGE-AT-0058]|nr:hypothetical protein BKA65DRAFT_291149 [Rhexocercosporidium sp. MPI-PUGE-AT-0058]
MAFAFSYKHMSILVLLSCPTSSSSSSLSSSSSPIASSSNSSPHPFPSLAPVGRFHIICPAINWLSTNNKATSDRRRSSLDRVRWPRWPIVFSLPTEYCPGLFPTLPYLPSPPLPPPPKIHRSPADDEDEDDGETKAGCNSTKSLANGLVRL